MDARRIAELLEPFLPLEGPRPNTQDLIPSISTYIDLLLRWNARVNLTAIRDREQIVTRHFGESLFAARQLFPNRAAERRQNGAHGASRGWMEDGNQAPDGRKKISLADVGSGPGFPGLPIKLWAPEISLTLIESNQKKATFLREVARALTLTDVNIQTTRAESLSSATFDVVTLRAVEHFTQVLPAAARLVKPGGRLALLIGSSQIAEAKEVLPTLSWDTPLPIPRSNARVMQVAAKNDHQSHISPASSQ